MSVNVTIYIYILIVIMRLIALITQLMLSMLGLFEAITTLKFKISIKLTSKFKTFSCVFVEVESSSMDI